MYRVWLELKKIIVLPAVWGFIAACLIFNAYLVYNISGDKYAEYIGHSSQETGFILGKEFDARLEQLAADASQLEYKKRLQEETSGMPDVFEGYRTGYIAERYISALELSGGIARDMRNKYAALQQVVDEKASKDESMTLYFAGSTYWQHWKLFGNLMSWLLLEGALISVLMALLAVGHEHFNHTEQTVYATKRGRRILRPKLAASLATGLGAYILLALLTLTAYFCVNDYGGIWGSSVSSGFNYMHDIAAGDRPYVTWHSFTVFTYFLAALGLSAGIIICCSLFGFVIGVLMRNGYLGFLVFLILCAACVAIPGLLPGNSRMKFVILLSPAWLWLKQLLWFTDGDFDILWRNFETVGLCASLLLAALLCLLSTVQFRKRDIQ